MHNIDDAGIEIEIHRQVGGVNFVSAVATGGRRAVGEFHSPLPESESRRITEQIEARRFDGDATRTLGATLFSSLFVGSVGELYQSLCVVGAAPALRLTIDDPAVARIPWELLYDPRRERYLALTAPLVRGISLQGARPSSSPQAPLIIWLTAATPADLEPLDATAEFSAILTALAPQIDSNQISVQLLEHLTLAGLQDAFRDASTGTGRACHVLHFLGHGWQDPTSGESGLILEDAAGQAVIVSSGDFAAVVSGHAVQLVMLNACRTAEISTLSMTAGLAPALLGAGVPAVIGMQAAIAEPVARAFAARFYSALADLEPVEDALLDARRLLTTDSGQRAQVAVPVCYMLPLAAPMVEPPQTTVSTSAPTVGEPQRSRVGRVLKQVGALVALLITVIGGYLTVREFVCTPPLVERLPRFGQEICGAGQSAVQEQMQGDFKIAVAEFGLQIDDDPPRQDAKGREFADLVYTALISDVASINTVAMTVWPPERIGVIEGATDAERAAFAEGRATQLNADLLVYGNIVVRDGYTDLLPHFYLSPTLALSGDEAGGDYDLGRMIHAPGDLLHNLATLEDLHSQFPSRVSGLLSLLIGLGYWGRDQFVLAEESFAAADRDMVWDTAKGREVTQIFLGALASQRHNYAVARGHYAQALAMNREYARAKLGEGQTWALEAQQLDCLPETVDPVTLQTAAAAYDAALEMISPATAEIPLKAALFRGRVYVCESRANLGIHWADAVTQFERVITEYENRSGNEKERIRYLAVEAWGGLGIVKALTAETVEDLHRAIDAFEEAIANATMPQRQVVWWLWKTSVHTQIGECANAQDAFAQAKAAKAEFEQRNPGMTIQNIETLQRNVLIDLQKYCASDIAPTTASG